MEWSKASRHSQGQRKREQDPNWCDRGPTTQYESGTAGLDRQEEKLWQGSLQPKPADRVWRTESLRFWVVRRSVICLFQQKKASLQVQLLARCGRTRLWGEGGGRKASLYGRQRTEDRKQTRQRLIKRPLPDGEKGCCRRQTESCTPEAAQRAARKHQRRTALLFLQRDSYLFLVLIHPD